MQVLWADTVLFGADRTYDLPLEQHDREDQLRAAVGQDRAGDLGAEGRGERDAARTVQEETRFFFYEPRGGEEEGRRRG